MKATMLESGQRWAIRDDRYEGWRYLTVLSVDAAAVVVQGPRGRKSTWKSGRFGRGARFTFCGHDGPGLLPPYSDKPAVMLGCFPFGVNPTTLPLEWELDPGFGVTTVTRDGISVWGAHTTRKRLAHVECWARETPGDWRLRIDGAMSERLYQRQESGWVLVAIGMGFA